MSGLSPDKKLVEVMEIKNHPWFVGVQFHPELKSTPFNPHPIFNSYIRALIIFRKIKTNEKIYFIFFIFLISFKNASSIETIAKQAILYDMNTKSVIFKKILIN